MTSAAQRAWEAENSILDIDPAQNALYQYDAEQQRKINSERPWSRKPNYFTSCRISALALVKMTTHARSGGNLEIMGLMTGYVSGTSIIVTDAFRLPVEGTETRVNAHTEAEEYMPNYLTASREGGGRLENAVGWYHSHPGYGCWLSGIDCATQSQQQTFSDPFVAVVIDPDRTVSAGKVEIGAFRTYPKDYKPPRSLQDDADEFQTIPSGKIEDFGAHASSYYALEVSHFKSSLDGHLLARLWNKYWVATLAQSPLYTNRAYVNAQITDHAVKIREAARKQKMAGATASARQELVGTTAGLIKMYKNQSMEQVVKGGDKIAQEEMVGLMAGRLKEKLFYGVVDEARRSTMTMTMLTEGENEVAQTNGAEVEEILSQA
jgi:COP9 signalosome complex subunit 5